MYRTTKRKAKFDTISILLPASWSGTDCLNDRPINDKISTNPHPDFLVTSDHPVFGANRPISLQYGQCGQSGLGIRIPHALLSSGNLTEFTSKSTNFFILNSTWFFKKEDSFEFLANQYSESAMIGKIFFGTHQKC